ncbi:hypothetical protein Agau_L300380 [Agrobacterium tumefaciens F2]|nr:hypothetical protein Agau_L300380 [Agrobacterium tumefaciens F2]
MPDVGGNGDNRFWHDGSGANLQKFVRLPTGQVKHAFCVLSAMYAPKV